MPFVRWVGDPDPVEADFERVKADIAAGKYTKEDVWAYNTGPALGIDSRNRRQIVMEGVSFRDLGPNEGLSRWYRWGPNVGTYVIHVTDADWRRIQELAEARTFALAVEQ